MKGGGAAAFVTTYRRHDLELGQRKPTQTIQIIRKQDTTEGEGEEEEEETM